MSGFGTGGGYQPVHAEPAPTASPGGKGGAWFGAVRLLFGGLSVVLAIDPGVTPGEVFFTSEGSRAAFGAVGAVLALTGLRGWLRARRGRRWQLSSQNIRRNRLFGGLMVIAGVWYQIAAWSDGAARLGLGLDRWAAPVYGLGGLLLTLTGLFLQLDPTSYVRLTRVKEGHGTRTTATVLRATDLGTLRNKAKVQVEMTIDVGGRTEHHSRKTLMDRTQLARIEGATVDVVVDPADPKIFDVKWDTLREAPPAEDAR